MKISSWNVNGLRSIAKKGFSDVLKNSGADIFAIQEIKCGENDIPPELRNIEGYHSFFSPAERKGYSGVAVYSKESPVSVSRGIGSDRFDKEGRVLTLEYPNFFFFGLYMPQGGREKENIGYKLDSYDRLLRSLEDIRNKPVIIAGDFNIAHKEGDLARPKENRDHIGFTSEERRKIDDLIGLGFKDSFREMNDEGGNYTWWSYITDARSRNAGWRIDYVFTRGVTDLSGASINKEILGSDHCPVSAETVIDRSVL